MHNEDEKVLTLVLALVEVEEGEAAEEEEAVISVLLHPAYWSNLHLRYRVKINIKN